MYNISIDYELKIITKLITKTTYFFVLYIKISKFMEL